MNVIVDQKRKAGRKWTRSRLINSSIDVTCRLRSYAVNRKKVVSIAELICGHLRVGGHQLSISIVNSEKIRNLNKKFRGIDQSTDILSFPQQEWQKPLKIFYRMPSSKLHRVIEADSVLTKHKKSLYISEPSEHTEQKVLGDIVISLDDAEQNAKKIGHNLDREFCFLLIHGILHLCGYDHQSPRQEKVMCEGQKKMMALLRGLHSKKQPIWISCVKRT